MYMESRIKELLKEKGITISDLADKSVQPKQALAVL